MIELCSPQDLRFRFGAALRRLWPELAATLTQIDYDRQMALVVEDAERAILGAGWLCADPEGETAEFALMARTDRQRHGLGGLILRALIDHGGRRGLARLWGETDMFKEHMIELAQSPRLRDRAQRGPVARAPAARSFEPQAYVAIRKRRPQLPSFFDLGHRRLRQREGPQCPSKLPPAAITPPSAT